MFTGRSGQTTDLRLLPVVIMTLAGANITPAGLGWKLKKGAGGWKLLLDLDDSKLPTPYVIDPALEIPVGTGRHADRLATLVLGKPAGAGDGRPAARRGRRRTADTRA